MSATACVADSGHQTNERNPNPNPKLKSPALGLGLPSRTPRAHASRTRPRRPPPSRTAAASAALARLVGGGKAARGSKRVFGCQEADAPAPPASSPSARHTRARDASHARTGGTGERHGRVRGCCGGQGALPRAHPQNTGWRPSRVAGASRRPAPAAAREGARGVARGGWGSGCAWPTSVRLRVALSMVIFTRQGTIVLLSPLFTLRLDSTKALLRAPLAQRPLALGGTGVLCLYIHSGAARLPGSGMHNAPLYQCAPRCCCLYSRSR